MPGAVEHAAFLVGRPYDDAYRSGDDVLYCSELVAEAFRVANGGIAVFDDVAMTFREPRTGRTSPYWRDHFTHLGLPVPEGEKGSNPVALAGSGALDIVHRYGDV